MNGCESASDRHVLFVATLCKASGAIAVLISVAAWQAFAEVSVDFGTGCRRSGDVGESSLLKAAIFLGSMVFTI